MQHERLEGWMVQQIEHANLAKETLLQLPTRPARSLVAPPASSSTPRDRERSPRRRPAPFTVREVDTELQPSTSPLQTPRQRHLRLFGGRVTSSTTFEHHEAPGERVADKQWRSQFSSRAGPLVESGRVDRTKVLRGLGADCEDGMEAVAASQTTPLLLWGLPREQILDFIRQSLLPSSWVDPRNAGEWEPAPSASSCCDDEAHKPAAAHSYVPLSPGPDLRLQLPSVASKPASRRSPRASLRPRTSPLPLSGAAQLDSPRVTSPRSDTRIAKVLSDLRSDPTLLAAFLRLKASDKLRENKERAATPRALADLEERKRLAEARAARVRQQRDRLVQGEDERFAASWAAYQNRVQPPDAAQASLSDVERVQRRLARRQRVWLSVVAFMAASCEMHARLVHCKVLQQVARLHNRSARVIQRLWRKWKWQNASRHTVVVYSWLRRCLWRLLFRVRVARKRRCAALLQRFMVDNFSGSRETRNFNHMMARWRGKVIHAQRLGLGFVLCSRARMVALSLGWDAVDHERQRSERQRPMAGDEEARSSSKRPSSSASSASSNSSGALRRVTFRPPRIESAAVETAAAPVSPSSAAGAGGTMGDRWSTRRSSLVMLQLDAVDDKLAAMQQLLTPVELQRGQKQPPRVVKVPKSIKTRLLYEHLVASRREYMKQQRAYREHMACASYAMEVKLDDARAIVQSSLSWRAASRRGSVGGRANSPAPPVFKLFSHPDAMAELVRRGVQLTLDSDPELRAVIERQNQRRVAMAAAPPPLGRTSVAAWGSPSSTAQSLLKKSLVVAAPPSASASSSSGRPAVRVVSPRSAGGRGDVR